MRAYMLNVCVQAIIDAVRPVTHIAPTDTDGTLVGEPATQEGVLAVPSKKLFLCSGVTNATYATTTEVYPDSQKVRSDFADVFDD